MAFWAGELGCVIQICDEKVLVQKIFGIADRNGQIGATKTVQDCKIYPDDFSVAIKKRTAGAAGSGCCVIDDFILQDIADVALRSGWTNQFLFGQVRNNFLNFRRVAQNFPSSVRSSAGKNSLDAGRIADQYNTFAGNASFTAIIEVQQRAARRQATFEAQGGNVRLGGNPVELGGNSFGTAGKIRGVGKHVSGCAVVGQRFQFVAAPPWLGNVVIGRGGRLS